MSKRDLTIVCGLCILVLADLTLAFLWSPPEQSMGNLVRVLYFHVSCAWIAFLSFFITAFFAFLYLLRRRMWMDAVSVSSAEIGVVYTSVTLITGSLWARPIWNTWWTWDPRLTTTLLLWFLYVAYLLLRGTMAGLERRARISGIFAIIAFLDVPIIHESVSWWRSIHPMAIDETGFHMPGSMVLTLMFSFVTFMALYALLLMLRTRQWSQRMRLYQARERLRAIRAGQERGVVS
ncbi:MAG: cytochrome c biogenesis protein CcsA [Alicyclobacillus sp.]|nr:cytochrome c biogenesis protein CcsA [Alicyclobacillus sp.]